MSYGLIVVASAIIAFVAGGLLRQTADNMDSPDRY